MHKNNDQAGQQAPIQSAEAQLRHVLSVATSEMGLVHEALDLDPAAPLDALEMVKAVKALKHELWCAEVNLDGAKDQLASTAPAHALTDAEIEEMWDAQWSYHGHEPCKLGHVEFARAIAAHLARKG